MSDLSVAPLKEAEADPAPPDFSDNPVCSGDGKTCGECGKIFSHPFYFSTHISIHASEKGYSMAGQCVHCGLTFSDVAIFQEHLVSSQAKLKVENETEEEEMSTTDCLEYNKAEQENEREKKTEDRRSHKLTDVKPALSRENVTVKQEILDPPDISHEPKAKRRRTSIQRYEPETHTDPDNDPAVEAYLMSLTKMGLTVDPAAFGHSSSRSRGKRGAQVRGRSRGHRQPFGRGSTLVLPREINVPKKPSPKYEYLDYDTILEDEGEILPKSGKQTRGERLQQRLQRLSQQKEPENQPTTALSDSVLETKAELKNEIKTTAKNEPKVEPVAPKPITATEKVSKPGSSGLSSYKTPKLDRSFAMDKNMIKAEMEDRDYTPHSRQQSKGKRGSRGSRGHQRRFSMPIPIHPPVRPQLPQPAPSIPGLTGYARANPNFRPTVVQTAVRPPPASKANKLGAIASQLKIKTPNPPLPSKFVRTPLERSTERASKTTKMGQAKEAFPKFLKVTSPKGIEHSKQESRDYVEIMLQTLSDELIPNKLSKTFPTSTTFFGNTVDVLTGTSARMPHSRTAFPGTIRPSRGSTPVRGSTFTDPYRGQVRQAGKAGFPDHSKVANFNFNNGTRFPCTAPVRAPRARGRAGASVGPARGRGQMVPAINRSGPLAQSLAYPVKIGRGVGRGEKNSSRPPVSKLAKKPVICTDEVIVLEDDDEEGDSSTHKFKSVANPKSTQPEKLTTVIVDIDKADPLKSKTEVILALAEKSLDSTDLTLEQDKKLNMPASVCLKRIDTFSSGSIADTKEDKDSKVKDKSSGKKEEEMEVEDIDGWKVCLAPNSDSESETEQCPDDSKNNLNEVIKEENPQPNPELPCVDEDEKSNRQSDKNENDSIEDGKTSDMKDASKDSISHSVSSSSTAVPLTFPPFIKDTDNLLDIFSEIEKTCKEIEENSGNEKEDSGTESESKESSFDMKTRTVAATSPQTASKVDDGDIEEVLSADCKVGNMLKTLGGDKDKSSQDLDKSDSPQHDSLPDKLPALSTKELEESAEARAIDHDGKNHWETLESDSCKAGMNEKEIDDKGDDVKATERVYLGGANSEDLGMDNGGMDAMTGFPNALKMDASDSNSDKEKLSLGGQRVFEKCVEDVNRQEVINNSNDCAEHDSGNLLSSNESCPVSKTLPEDRDDNSVAQSGFEAMETDDGNIKEAPAANTVEMDNADACETLPEPHTNTIAGQGELEACERRLNEPSSEINENNENLTDIEGDLNKSLLSCLPLSVSDKNNALVKLADSKNVSGNGPGANSINKLNLSKTLETNVAADKEPDLKVTSPVNIPFENPEEDVTNIPCETVSESTELSQTPTTDGAMPSVSENCAVQQDSVLENDTDSKETFKKRSPGRTSCKDLELTPSHYDGEDDADRDGSDHHGSGSNGSGSSQLNGVACTASGEKDSTAANTGDGKSQSVNVSDCDTLSTSGSGRALVEKTSIQLTKSQKGKCSFINVNCKRWERGSSQVTTKNANAIMSLCICPSQVMTKNANAIMSLCICPSQLLKSLKISPKCFKQVCRLQKTCVRSHKSVKKICNRPPRALTKRYSTPQSFKMNGQRLKSVPAPSTLCTSGEGHPFNEHTIMYNDGCSDSDHEIKSVILGSQCDANNDLMGKIYHNSHPHHKHKVMFSRLAECCPVWPFSFESFDHNILQHTGSHCVIENSFRKMYKWNFSKTLCPQNVLLKIRKLMNLKSGALSRKLRLNKFPYHHTTVHRGNQSGSRSHGQHEQQRGSGQSSVKSIGCSSRNRGNSSLGLTGDRSGGNGDHEDDENRDERGRRLDVIKEENPLKCSVCGARFEFFKEWQKHLLKQHARHEGHPGRLQQGFILPSCKKKPQRFCAERTDSFSRCIESSHLNGNTYENLTIGKTQVVLVKPNKPVVSLSSPGKTKKAAKRPGSKSLKLPGRDSKKNDTKTSEVEFNLRSDKGSYMGRRVPRKLRLKKHLTVKIPCLVKGITETKLTGIFRANKSIQQCVGGQEHVKTSNISVVYPPNKPLVNSLPLLGCSRAIKTEPPSPGMPASGSTSCRAEPKLLSGAVVKTEPCSDYPCSLPIKLEPLSDEEDDSLPVTFGDSCLFKRESPVDLSTQQTDKTTSMDSKTIPTPKHDNEFSPLDERIVKGDLHSISLNLRSPKKFTQKEQEFKTEIVFVYPNKPVINALPRSHSLTSCPDLMLDTGTCEPHKNERKGIGNTGCSSVLHCSPKQPIQKDQEAKIVYVYPNKPVINVLPRNHSDRTPSATRKEAAGLTSTRCSKQDDPQQVLYKGGNVERLTSAPKAEHRGRQTTRIDTTISLRESSSGEGQENKPQTNTPILVYVHPKQPVVNFSGRALRSSPALPRHGPLRKAKAKTVKCS